MRDNDAILVLLADIKELLYSIALLILAVVLILFGAVYINTWGYALMVAGLFVGIAGGMYARHGFHHHEVVEHEEKQD